MKFIIKPSESEDQKVVEGAVYVIDGQGLKIYDESSNLLALFTEYKWMTIKRGEVATSTAEAEESK